MHYSGTHYLMSQATNKAVFGPLTCGEVVDIINAMPKGEAIKYYNASRYQLAKMRLYPANQAGESALKCDVSTSGITPEIQPRHGFCK